MTDFTMANVYALIAIFLFGAIILCSERIAESAMGLIAAM